MNDQPIPTPRCDSIAANVGNPMVPVDHDTWYDFARTLERELVQKEQENETLRKAHNYGKDEHGWTNCRNVQCSQSHSSLDAVCELLKLEVDKSLYVVGKTVHIMQEIVKREEQVQSLQSELSKKFPDIGPDPLKADGEEREKLHNETRQRIEKACAIQQSGVPDQTALTWRIDLSRIRDDLTIAEARVEILTRSNENLQSERDKLSQLCLVRDLDRVQAVSQKELAEERRDWFENELIKVREERDKLQQELAVVKTQIAQEVFEANEERDKLKSQLKKFGSGVDFFSWGKVKAHLPVPLAKQLTHLQYETDQILEALNHSKSTTP